MFFTLDWLVVIAIALISALNRQSLVFLFLFTLSNLAFAMIDSGFIYSLFVSLAYALFAVVFNSVKDKLKIGMVIYSLLHWFSAVDYILTTQETFFYVIFPYIVKLVDAYIIFHLLTKEGRGVGAFNSPFGSTWFKRLADL